MRDGAHDPADAAVCHNAAGEACGTGVRLGQGCCAAAAAAAALPARVGFCCRLGDCGSLGEGAVEVWGEATC